MARGRNQSTGAEIPGCHPDRKHKGLGMCGPCYNLDYLSKIPKDELATKRRADYVKHYYKITDEPAMLAAQDFGCAVCGTPDPGDANFHVDHDHKCCSTARTCGECVRGLVCAGCNTMLAMARDSAFTLRAGATYLEDYMARKSDFAGDRFGDWLVGERVTEREDWMESGKRYWNVTNTVTFEARVVLQTALASLPKEDVVAPVKLVANGSNLGWAADLPTAEYEGATAFADWDEDYHVGEAPELEHILSKDCPCEPEVEIVLNADGKIPATNNGEQVLAPDWAEKAVALMGGPIKPITGVADVLHNLGVVSHDEVLAEFGLTRGQLAGGQEVHFEGGIGMAAEETVSEAELDERVPAPDPIRTAIRKIMGEVHTIREQANALDEQVVELRNQADGVMALVDDLLKAVLTR